MDPYLEGDLWPDVHHALATQIRRQLTPLVQPKYVARISRYVVEDNNPEQEIGIMYPDVELLQIKREVRDSEHAYANRGAFSPPALSIPILEPVEVEIPVVEIYDVLGNRLITAIEILSPVNKRSPGREQYLNKRQRLYKAGTHFLEIDLLRRGTRSVQHARLAASAYLIALTPASARKTDVWPLALSARLPIVPVPLLPEDQDVLLDLQKALSSVYEEAAYQLSIDYSKAPPPPALSEAEQDWLKSIFNA
jgi:hypothetical protein